MINENERSHSLFLSLREPTMKLLHVVLLTSAAAWLSACGRDASAPPQTTAEVGVVTLKAQAVPLQAELAGRTSASLVADVRPQVNGIIRSRKFTEGTEVKAGQVLYEIDPAAYRADYEQAKASLADAQASLSAARLKYERYDELAKIEGVSQQDADDARLAYEQAEATLAQRKAALESARIDLEYTQVKAPISGRIGKSAFTPGALVTANQSEALATIRALDPIYVDLQQSSAELLELREMLNGGFKQGGTSVRLKLENGAEYADTGVLKFGEVAVDEATGSVTLRAEFPNADRMLLPGMYVRAVLDQAVDPSAILAPQQGITRDPKGNAIALVVNAQSKVEQRTVTTGRVIGDQWLVSEGLRAGDRLVVEGLNKVKSGDTVRSVEVTENSELAAAAAPLPSGG